MTRSRRTVGLLAAVAAALVLVVGTGVWWLLIRDDAPEAASIDAAGATLDEAAAEGEGAGEASAVDGEWTVDTSLGSFDDFSGTWAGYRVDEELATVGAATAVGRTPDVSGTMTVAGAEVTAVQVEVDVTTLTSDSDRRDGALRSRGLETERFPTATFALTSPIGLPAGAAPGETVSAQATGDLTVHGVTREVTVDVEAEVSATSAAVVGRAPVKLTDFGIDPPTGLAVLSIRDEAVFEFQIFFSKT